MESIRVSAQGAGFRGERFWRIAFFAAIGSLGVVPQAEAAIYYWQESGLGFSQSIPTAPPRQLKARRHRDIKPAVVENESAKPQGPLVISISIAEQKLRLYDANGLFTESPVSTGVPGHPTPMGVFSVIQKQKFHQSNIYSGAPMPFMQRITWSGIALHAGVVPGHPASHGCVRMPAAFAVKMWNWTRMGARVIITPGPVSPTHFSHPLLATLKVLPPPVTADEPKSNVAGTPDRAPKNAMNAPVAPEPKVELRSAAWNQADTKPLDERLGISTAPSTQTADASSTLPGSASMSDAAAVSDFSKSETSPSEPAIKAPSQDELKPEPSKPQAASKETGSAGPLAAAPPKTVIEKQAEQPADPAQPALAAPGTTNNPAPGEVGPTPTAKPDLATLIKRSGQIAIFVSRKDSKLYVRQNFSPLFELPVTIAADERPLGTHVFTAQVDRRDANVLHWSVVSLPAPNRLAERAHENERLAHGRKLAKPIEVKAPPLPDGPAEALDRVNLPAETMARLFEAMSTGGSIIVSDQGISAGETGEGTDFIVSLR